MKIAIIGAGIAGLSAAHFLHRTHEITVYERNSHAGGHARTRKVDIPGGGTVPVDTGFIVYNRSNYPRLSSMFDALDVATTPADMSFGVSIGDGWLEYGTRSLAGLFSQARNVGRPQYWKMLRDIVRFNHRARAYLDAPPELTVGDLLSQMRMGPWFRHYYLLAMAGAIWSTTPAQINDFPARSLLRFFENHGLLQVFGQPQWYCVQGGSREYVRRLSRPFAQRLFTGRQALRVTPGDDGAGVTDSDGAQMNFNHVIFACHADEALRLLSPPTECEARILSQFSFTRNIAILHRDRQLMPRRRRAWASWIYRAGMPGEAKGPIALTYWMNSLQRLDTDMPLFVSLNPDPLPHSDLCFDTHEFHHPRFDAASIRAQGELTKIQGVRRLWFCGAWCGYGFHEDGVASAARIADAIKAYTQQSDAIKAYTQQ